MVLEWNDTEMHAANMTEEHNEQIAYIESVIALLSNQNSINLLFFKIINVIFFPLLPYLCRFTCAYWKCCITARNVRVVASFFCLLCVFVCNSVKHFLVCLLSTLIRLGSRIVSNVVRFFFRLLLYVSLGKGEKGHNKN